MKGWGFLLLRCLFVCVCGMLSSCSMVPPDSTIDWCFGTPSLHPHTGQALCRSFDNYRPQTLREMESLMGKAADVEYKAPEGLYSLWGYRQTNTGGFFYSSKVCCVSVKGQIIAVAALYPTRSGQGVAAGDKYLFDGGTQPKAVGKVCDMFFRCNARRRMGKGAGDLRK